MHEDGNRRGVTQRIRHGGRGWELRETSRASAGYAPHVHDTFSLGQILGGRSRCLIGGKTRRIATGACVWVRAGEVHACNPRPGAPWSYRMLHIDPAWLRAQGVSEPHSGVSASRALWLDYEALAHRVFEDAPRAETEAAMLRLVRRLAPESAGLTSPGAGRRMAPPRCVACANTSRRTRAKPSHLTNWPCLRGRRRGGCCAIFSVTTASRRTRFNSACAPIARAAGCAKAWRPAMRRSPRVSPTRAISRACSNAMPRSRRARIAVR